jgi:hypothetical protein
MLIKVMEWEMNARKGNWVSAVAPRSGKAPASAPAQVAKAPAPRASTPAFEIDDDIPF